MKSEPVRLREEPLAGEGGASKAEPEPNPIDHRATWIQPGDASRARSIRNPSRLDRLVGGFIRRRSWLWGHFDDLFSEAWMGLDSALTAVEEGREVENLDGYVSAAAWNGMRRWVKGVTREQDRQAPVMTTAQGFEHGDGTPVQIVNDVPPEELEAKWLGLPPFCIAVGCTSSLQGKRSDALTCGQPRCKGRVARGQVKTWAQDEE